MEIFDVLNQPGQHGLIYGERGVGKTSLAFVTSLMVAGKWPTLNINCDSGDNFASVWNKVLDGLIEELSLYEEKEVTAELQILERASERLMGDEIGPDRVRAFLKLLAAHAPVTIFLDEFDTISERSSRELFADTIKTLSDQMVDATLVLVGVADTVEELLTTHESTERALVQIHLPRMNTDELLHIVDRGMSAAGITADPHVAGRIVSIAKGFPSYVHLIAQDAGRAVVFGNRYELTLSDVAEAVTNAVNKAQQSIRSVYNRAVSSPRSDTLFSKILLACALHDGDELGFFSPGEIRGLVAMTLQRDVSFGTYSRHLAQFCDNEHGPILQRRGKSHTWRYRFINPMVIPYVIMKGIESGLIEDPDNSESATPNARNVRPIP